MWQVEADTELTLSASQPTAVGQSKLYPGESRLEYGNAIYFIAIVSRHVLKIEKNASCLPYKNF